MENQKVDCEGRRLLLLKASEMRQSALARLLGADVSAVSRWLHSSRRPSADMRFRMEMLLGIPAQSWSVLTHGPETEPVAAAE